MEGKYTGLIHVMDESDRVLATAEGTIWFRPTAAGEEDWFGQATAEVGPLQSGAYLLNLANGQSYFGLVNVSVAGDPPAMHLTMQGLGK